MSLRNPDIKSHDAGHLSDSICRMWVTSDRPAKLLAATTLAFLVISSAATVLGPVILKALVDLLDDEPHGGLMPTASLVGAYAATHLAAKGFGELQSMFLGRTDQRLHRLLSDSFFRHVMALPLAASFSQQTGALTQTLANGLQGYRIVLHHAINSILPITSQLLAISTVLLLLGHPTFVVVVIVSAALFSAVFVFAAARVRGPANEVASAHVACNAMFADSLMNFEAVKRLRAERHVSRGLKRSLIDVERHWRCLYRRRTEGGLAFSTVFAASIGVTAYVAMRDVQSAAMSLGDFVLVNAYVLQIVRPVERVGFAVRDISQALAFVANMSSILDMNREPLSSGLKPRTSIAESSVTFNRVSLAYGGGRFVLRDLEFMIPPGTTLAVVGPSGSGKSSIVRLMLRLVEPSAGEIRIGGIPLTHFPIGAIRDAIAVVPQDTILLNETVATNIAIGRPRATRLDVVQAAVSAGIHDFIQTLPKGYDTTVGERGLRLSGGERQRIAIARAAIRRPAVLILDEATSSLDSFTEKGVLRNLRQLMTATTTVVISHSLEIVSGADQILVLRQGRIVEGGTHEDLLARNGLYALMWNARLSSSQDVDSCQIRRAS